MPTTTRTRELPSPPAEVWRLVGDPHHFPRWWPRVMRVEDVREGRFTEVLTGARSGRSVRADFRIKEKRKERLLRFSQDIDGTPFEKVLKAAETQISLEPAGEGTAVSIAMRQRPRGLARFGGGTMMRRATRRIIDEALDGLEAVLGQA